MPGRHSKRTMQANPVLFSHHLEMRACLWNVDTPVSGKSTGGASKREEEKKKREAACMHEPKNKTVHELCHTTYGTV